MVAAKTRFPVYRVTWSFLYHEESKDASVRRIEQFIVVRTPEEAQTEKANLMRASMVLRMPVFQVFISEEFREVVRVKGRKCPEIQL